MSLESSDRKITSGWLSFALSMPFSLKIDRRMIHLANAVFRRTRAVTYLRTFLAEQDHER